MKYIIPLLIFFTACNSSKLPSKRFQQTTLELNHQFQDSTLEVSLNNSLHCPIRVWVNSKDSVITSYFDSRNPIVLKPFQDSIITMNTLGVSDKDVYFGYRFGDLDREVTASKVELPFPKGKSYSYVQGYNSKPTHNTNWSRYAMDFGLAIGDTICAATDGYVIGVVEGYKNGGTGSKWKNFGNFITLYDPSTGLFTQYVHLKHLGSLVEVGQQVKAGDKIAISGMTGQTNIAHLHFNCLKPSDDKSGLISMPIDSIGTYKVSELKRNQMIRNE